MNYCGEWKSGLSPWINEKFELLGHKGKEFLDTGLFDTWMDTKFECGGKKRYGSRNEANREIYRLMKESFSNTTFLRSYKCKYCHGYHFTSNFE
jgi:hypothetical protein